MQFKRSLIAGIALIALPMITAWAGSGPQVKYKCFEQGKESLGCAIPNQTFTFDSSTPVKKILTASDNTICYKKPIPTRSYYASFTVLPNESLPEGSKVKLSLIHGPNVKIMQGDPSTVVTTGETTIIQWQSNFCQVLHVQMEPA